MPTRKESRTTVDERIEKITQTLEAVALRHESLAQALDLVTRRHESLGHSVELLSTFHQEGFAQVTRNFETVLDSIKRLEDIARSQEQRSSGLEGQR